MYKKCHIGVLIVLMMTSITLAQDEIHEGLIGYWKFDENQGDTANDSSGFGNTGTLTNTPVWTQGKLGSALSFDGSYVDCGLEAGNGITDTLTLAAWININVFRDWAAIVIKGVSGGAPYGMYTGINGELKFMANNLTVANAKGGQAIMTSTAKMTTGVWNHVAVTFGNNTVCLYINGELTDTFETKIVIGSREQSLIIGANLVIWADMYYRGLIDEVLIYDRALSPVEIKRTMVGIDSATAYAPAPANHESDIVRDGLTLTWRPGYKTTSHDVYFGTVLADVENATVNASFDSLLRAGYDANSIGLPRLTFDKTYYWRVDEATSNGSKTKGEIWQFTVEPFAVPVVDISVTASGADSGKDPNKTIDGSGLNAYGQHSTLLGDMWQTTITDTQPWIQYAFDEPHKLYQLHVWNHNSQYEKLLGYGIKEALIENSLDGQTWTELKTVELAQASGQANYTGEDIPLNEIVAKFVKITANSNWGQNKYKTYGLSEVRFEAIPTFARELSPAGGAVVSGTEVTLEWRNGREAAQHKVYLDVEANLDLVQASAPASLGITMEAQGAYDSYTASDLDLAQTYVWKVLEVNEAQTPSTYASPIQSFTTSDYLVLDDMESYNNIENLPWMTWADGYEVPGNGSLVGADPVLNDFSPETEVVHSGSQSLPIWIDNTTASYSEATRSFAPSENWTLFGITTLSLFVRVADNMGGSLYVKINNNKVPLAESGPYPAGFDPGWVQYAVDLTAMNVSSVTSLAVGVEGAGAMSVIYVDDIRLYAGSPELTTLTLIGSVIEAESGALTGPWEIRDDPNASGGQYIIIPKGVIPNATDKPASSSNGWAVYTLNIPADGDYIVALRGLNEVAGDTDDSLWFNIPGAILNDAVQAPQSPGWLLNENLFDGPQGSIVWDLVHDDYDDVTDPVVFTLTAGPHELQISHREDGTGLDAIAILAVNRN
jgi:hypothetical protein